MKDEKIKYFVVNVFSEISESERKEKINQSIRALCASDIEKVFTSDYNNCVAVHSSVSTLNEGGIL